MFFRRLKDTRVDHDKTQKDIAELLQYNRRVYSRYESGVRTIPIELLIKLADLYETSIDYLVGRTDEPKPYSKAKK